MIDKVEAVIAEEMPAVEAVRADVFSRTEGKTAMLFVGGSRADHYQELFKEMGMKTLSAGYEFSHRDDYEGRKVLPDIKVDADSRNIEELSIEAQLPGARVALRAGRGESLIRGSITARSRVVRLT